MNLSNCSRCGKVFMKVKSSICSDCQREEEALAQKVMDYLRDNPGSTIAEVATELEVEVEFINKMLREGRLNSVKTWKVRCRECGAEISSGEYCSECRNRLASEFSKALPGKSRPKVEDETLSKKSTKVFLIDRVKEKD